MLPALLQRLDRVNVQLRLGAQHLRFVDHGLAMRQALSAGCFKRGIGCIHRSFPDRLNFSEGFFVQVASCCPLLDKTIQAANLVFPVGVADIGCGPDQYLIDQHPALGLDDVDLLLGFFQPDFDHFVRFIAGVVKTLPQRVVGCAALVAGFPLLAHPAQGFLLFAPAQGLGHQSLGFNDQLFADLVGAPALPAFKLAGGSQRRMGCSLKLAVNVADMFFQGIAQVSGRLGRGLAVSLGNFLLQFGQRVLHDGCRLHPHFI